MSKQRKKLHPARAKPGLTGLGKKRRVRRGPSWQGTWLRILITLTVVSFPLIAAGLVGSSIRGEGWKGMLKGMSLAGASQKGANGEGDSSSVTGNSNQEGGGEGDFGRVKVKIFNPITRRRLQADFHLKGVTVIEDGPELEKFVKNKYQFIREQATIAVRNSNAVELADPKRIMLERRILIRINRSLDRPVLKSVDLDKFSLSESAPELDLMAEDEEK